MALRIAADLELPLDLVVQKIAILARSGAGKTNTAVDVVEELLEAKQQVVILDPPGAWWGLRTSADGTRAGYPVVVLGGVHGDLPLESTSGELIADLVVDQGLSMVLDLSEFTDGEMYRFVEAFARRLFARKNKVRDPMLVVFEEADELAPQTVRPNQAQLVHAMERIAKRGRMRGIGFLAISQRTASLNWNVLSQAEVLIAHQTTADLDIKAIDGWIQRTGDQEKRRQVLAELAHLPVGTAYLWSPSWLRLFRKIHFRKRRTFDSSATPEPGKRVVQPKTRADVDLEQLRTRMAATIEKAKADDPRELRKRIAELERQVATKPTAQVVDRAEVSRLEQNLRDAKVTIERMELGRDRRLAAMAKMRDALGPVLAELNIILGEPQVPYTPAPPVEPVRQPVARIDQVPREHRRPPPHSPAPRPEHSAPNTADISAPQQRILDALASFEAAGLRDVAKSNAAVFAGQSSTSSGFTNNLGALRTRGLIEYPAGGRVGLTDAGRAIAAPTEPIRSLEQLHEAWRAKLSAPQWRILDALLECYPEPLVRDELASIAGQSPTSSGYTNNLGALRSLGLVDYPSPRMVVATELLFPALSGL